MMSPKLKAQFINTIGRKQYNKLCPEVKRIFLIEELKKFNQDMRIKFGSQYNYMNWYARKQGFENLKRCVSIKQLFPQNTTLASGLLMTEIVLGPRSPKWERRLSVVLSYPVVGFGEQPWFGALFFMRWIIIYFER